MGQALRHRLLKAFHALLILSCQIPNRARALEEIWPSGNLPVAKPNDAIAGDGGILLRFEFAVKITYHKVERSPKSDVRKGNCSSKNEEGIEAHQDAKA